jgi:hypothetical protein
MPASDSAGREIAELHASEGRQDVQSQLALVHLSRARAKRRSLGKPSPGVFLKNHAAGERVDPGVASQVRPNLSQMGVSLTLGTERLGRGVFDPIHPVPASLTEQ